MNLAKNCMIMVCSVPYLSSKTYAAQELFDLEQEGVADSPSK
jgi:hypothetical protein